MPTDSGLEPATRTDRIIGAAVLALALVYLATFVPRGWIPHDEGMLGQIAERVLAGELPHVDYQEPYTGGLSWLYAAVFRVAGVDLLHIRWLLFVAASLATLIVYRILRRYLGPIGASVGAVVSLAWSFPNYFAGLPSWWILLCALVCVWAFIRFVETDRIRYVATAGLSVGVAIVIKQTGVYLLVALVLALLIDGRGVSRIAWPLHPSALLRSVLATGALGFAIVVLHSRLGDGEFLYLLVPVAASITPAYFWRGEEGHRRTGRDLARLAAACSCAAFPFVALAIPYALGGHLPELISGTIVLPLKRLTYASVHMPPAGVALAAVAMAGLMLPVPASMQAKETRVLTIGRWAVAITVPILSLWTTAAYQFVWQSARTIAALLPVLTCCLLLTNAALSPSRRRVLFMAASMLAWASLVQFPFGAPIYFCYVAPLAVIAGAAAASGADWLRTPGMVRWIAVLLIFSAVTMHRGYVGNLGFYHHSSDLTRPLGLPRASLLVSEDDAATYGRVVSLVQQHRSGGPLIAGPDCPEVYFLAGVKNEEGTLFDFFAAGESDVYHVSDAPSPDERAVVVLNHRPQFSPRPSEDLVARLRRQFPSGETAGRFEVRWR